MNQLIKIETKIIGNEEINAINARELHEFLEVKEHFTDWIKRYLNEYGFVINSDFCRTSCIAENGRTMEDYLLSIDMAKELSMLSKAEKGKEARKYFIACEKKLKEVAKPMTAMQMLEAQLVIMKEQEEKMLRLEAEQRGLADKQTETDIKLNLIESKISTSNSDYYSVSGYASLKGHRHLDIRRANLIGRLAAKLSREYDIDVGKVKDERYGHVNTYHIDILNEAFNKKI